MKRLTIMIFLSILFQINLLAQYNIEVGSYEYLSVDPPKGYARSATWSCDEGLTLTERSEVGAIVKVTHYFTGAAYVTCNYVYEYLGSYDHNYHAGQGTKTYRIQCIGGTASISETELNLNLGEKHTLTCTRSDNYGTPIWESSNEDVVTIDSKGKLKAVGTGYARITLDPIIAEPCFCDVHVKKVDAKTMELTPNPLSVIVSKTKSLKPVYTPSGASASITWTSENENIATVTSSGVVKGISEGTTAIVATTDNGLTAKAMVKVVGAPTALHLPQNVEIPVGYNYTLIPSLTPSESETTYKWKSSDTSVATVTSTGKIYGKKEGQATITVTTDNNLTASTTVYIVSSPSGLDEATTDYRVKKINNLVKKLSK